jgi:hypothetical protein
MSRRQADTSRNRKRKRDDRADSVSHKELPPAHGRGVEIVQKKQGRSRFIATRVMVFWNAQ